MANTIDFHAKLIIGNLVLQLAEAAAANEALQEKLAAVAPPLPHNTTPTGSEGPNS